MVLLCQINQGAPSQGWLFGFKGYAIVDTRLQVQHTNFGVINLLSILIFFLDAPVESRPPSLASADDPGSHTAFIIEYTMQNMLDETFLDHMLNLAGSELYLFACRISELSLEHNVRLPNEFLYSPQWSFSGHFLGIPVYTTVPSVEG